MIPAPASLARRLRLPPRNEALPLALLLLALSSVFAFGGDRSQFYRKGHHNFISEQTLAVAANLSAEHGFTGIPRQRIGEDGEPEYVPYNPHPIGSTALVKIAILPFGDGGARQVLAARLLMLGCFAAAAAFAYLALARLLSDRWIAVAATLPAFSSYYLLYYGDAISAEMSTNVLGIALVFHGLVQFTREGRFRQLLVKTAVAILLGWHVAGLVAPFALIGLGGDLLRARADGGFGARAALAAAARSRYLAYGAFFVLCCALPVGWNIASEYRALGGAAPADLPSVQALLGRSGVDAQAYLDALGLDPLAFLRSQFGGIGGMAIPFAAADRLGLDLARPFYGPWPPPHAAPWLAALGAAACAACLAGLRFLRCRAAVAALLLTGWGWAIAFRAAVGGHEYEAMFHLGVPLILYALALLGLRRLLGRERAARALPAIALAAAAVFALSARDMAGVGHDAEAARRQREVRADFQAVRAFTDGRSLLLSQIQRNDDAPRHRVSYWLAGSYLQTDGIGTAEEWARAFRHDYLVLSVDLGGSLTPDNRHLFLYRPSGLDAAYAAVADREPGARSAFEVRLDGRTLTWTRDECSPADTQIPFFVRAVPPAANAPATGLPEAAFEAYAPFFPFGGKNGVRFGGRCIASLELPDEPIAGVRTGQRPEGLPALWEASLPVDDASFPRGASTWRDALAAPALASEFEVHAAGRTLTYAREQCTEADIEPRFFVHAVAADSGGLPEDRRRYGSERLTFEFRDRGLRYEGACLTAFELPDYAILGVRTGQYDGEGEVWAGEFPLDPEAWRARFGALAAREPALRAAFDVHLDGRTLHYLREDCAASDTEARFFLHVTPLDAGDLPEARRASGFDNLDFAFGDRGLRYGGRCMASAELPDYPVARVVTGQHEAGAHLWEAEIALGEASR